MKRYIKLDTSELQKLADDLKDYAAAIEKKNIQFVAALSDNIESEAQKGFRNAISDVFTEGTSKSGTSVPSTGSDVEVRAIKSGDKALVYATGSQTSFIEFGAGVHFNGSAGTSPHPEGARLGAIIGGYGKGNGKKDKWSIGKGVWSYGTPMQAPLWTAGANARYNADKIARDVFATYESV